MNSSKRWEKFEGIEDQHWRDKVDSVVKISKQYGYPEYNVEFWAKQTAGIVSLIIDIYEGR